MPDKKMVDLFRIGNRFLRSAHLERDFQDPSAMAGYVVTDFTRNCLGRMAGGLKPRSGQRAWRMTGDYGSGKSSFALLLAHCFSSNDSTLPPQIRKVVDFHHLGVARPHLIPVLVTCSKQPLGTSILQSLFRILQQTYGRNSKAKLVLAVKQVLDSNTDPTEEQVFQFILEANSQLIADGKAKGLLLILDELGKFLEFAALYPQRQDVFLLQQLAEAASRSDDEPLFIVSLLHQGFKAYSDQLNQSAQREWEKVAGRFEEIVFEQPIEQIVDFIGSALNVVTTLIPKDQVHELKAAMEDTAALGWFGAASRKLLVESANRLYPLHPSVLPVLIRIFRRFGQNERSMFSFLLSKEPFGLQAFAEKRLQDNEFYRLHHFYDYVRANFGHRLSIQSYRSHWSLIDSVVESFATDDELQLKVLKTAGILNLLDDRDLCPSEAAILNAMAGNGSAQQKLAGKQLEKLHRGKRVLYNRGASLGFCLWPHTSVDLEKALDEAKRAVSTPQRVATLVKNSLESRPIVARRHYIETGNLRYAEVRYCSVTELDGTLENGPTEADGLIIFPLCETPTERNTALAFAQRPEMHERPTWLVAVPQPLNSLASLVQEFQRWEWISTNVLELNADKYAREEVSRQKEAARMVLEKRIQNYIGFKQLSGQTMLDWFHLGDRLEIANGRQLLERLSSIFDNNYPLAPKLHNELVNRRNLSSAAAAAQMRLIKLMFESGSRELLGMDRTKKPPEMSMYLSVLKNTGIHQPHGEQWKIDEPAAQADQKCRVLPALNRIREIVQQEPDSRVNVVDLFDELRKPPYGVRDGLLPLLLTVFAIAHEKDVVFYKDGSFLRELSGETMQVLSKAPERFDVQHCIVEGVRAELFEKLLLVLDVKAASTAREVEIMDVVKKLCVFIAQLPAYVLNTKKLPATALAVRDIILGAQEPAKLLFNDLPAACGFEPISANEPVGISVQAFVKTLKSALDDLRTAFPELQERQRRALRNAFNLPGNFQAFRTALASRAESVVVGVNEPNLRAFCLRLMDDNLPEFDWLESLGSYLALKPPAKWHDAEEDLFHSELFQCAAKFHRVESIVFARGAAPRNGTGIRLAITQANGIEHEQVFHFTPEEEQQLKDLQQQFEALLTQDNRLGMAAVSRAIWSNMEKAEKSKR